MEDLLAILDEMSVETAESLLEQKKLQLSKFSSENNPDS